MVAPRSRGQGEGKKTLAYFLNLSGSRSTLRTRHTVDTNEQTVTGRIPLKPEV